MLTSPLDPLENAREAAVGHFSRLLLWICLPVYAALFAANWRVLINEPLRLPAYVLIPFVGMLVRPSPSRSLHSRGQLAIWSLTFVTTLAVLKTGLRLPYAVAALAMTFAMVALFGSTQRLVQWIALLGSAGVAGVVMRRLEFIHPTPVPPPTLSNEVYVLGICLAACVFVAVMLNSTVQIYRHANAAQQTEYLRRLDAEREAQQLQRQELVATMARGMAHDLANMVQVVSANVELLRDSHDEASRQRMAADAAGATDRATRTLRGLLAVGRATASPEGCTDVASLFRRLESLLGPVVGSRITVDVQCRSAARVKMDEAQLEQVLLNLAFNARDAMPRGGTLLLTADDEHDGGGAERPARIRIEVSDTGTGIPAELLPRIFDPYVTSKAAGQGTGLGLAIVSRAVDDAGGQIEVESREGVGTRFVIRVPAVPA